ncbi:MAG: hypothetical protein LBT96_00485 [Campylobacteraceae bacterium]|nr:hypothetical protein [Campylobacteraceae bacterium]
MDKIVSKNNKQNKKLKKENDLYGFKTDEFDALRPYNFKLNELVEKTIEKMRFAGTYHADINFFTKESDNYAYGWVNAVLQDKNPIKNPRKFFMLLMRFIDDYRHAYFVTNYSDKIVLKYVVRPLPEYFGATESTKNNSIKTISRELAKARAELLKHPNNILYKEHKNNLLLEIDKFFEHPEKYFAPHYYPHVNLDKINNHLKDNKICRTNKDALNAHILNTLNMLCEI